MEKTKTKKKAALLTAKHWEKTTKNRCKQHRDAKRAVASKIQGRRVQNKSGEKAATANALLAALSDSEDSENGEE